LILFILTKIKIKKIIRKIKKIHLYFVPKRNQSFVHNDSLGNLSKTIDNIVLKLVPVASDTMITDLGTAARLASALQIATATIYGDLVSFQSVTLPLQQNTQAKRKR
jgi:hypothetical protein